MTHQFYLLLHLVGVLFLFIGLGSALLPSENPQRKAGLPFHGVGLFLLLLGGFGMIAKLKIGFDWWIITKLVLWFDFGALPILGKRGILPAPAAYGIAIALGIVAIVLGTTHGNVSAIFAK